jgi:hypothetical protein
MERRTIGLAAAGLLIAFLLGFVPTYAAKRHAQHELEAARLELRLSRLQGRLGAAMAESLRSNYERARQLMAGYFSDLQGAVGQVENPAEKQALNAILAQRDEMITLLSRAQPESTQRLMLLYTQMFAATDPQGAVAPAVTLPPAAPQAAPAAPPAAPAETSASPAEPAGTASTPADSATQ